ncbi:hypothetical protein AUK11_00635 [bacterium CG2_30_37_16]|nr:MAG: hypothetical protein AUK11_00635 [bacterium CG2_30_37_16]PIP30374.1 MAG: hypothetical protein COX25_05070 [bacterium (Candidatus Howlettbacteria) CG23_combo_of_CG06-09_8_20_14_all_37_9]PIX98584.1 MAG: hypothetical protein COZ22_04615 [bacterium (Candidatus Howlettbacteria) CG_4_10_14_3_um_filter_37_10]PJB06980.1 MAG: hypothetical protein CO123_00960 [bacterium (Candidatus Howlettbacteria) CG_4_9_14_3_um_filter_37_10]
MRWVQEKIDQSNCPVVKLKPQDTCLCIDATDFGGFLVLVFRSPELKKTFMLKLFILKLLRSIDRALST